MFKIGDHVVCIESGGNSGINNGASYYVIATSELYVDVSKTKGGPSVCNTGGSPEPTCPRWYNNRFQACRRTGVGSGKDKRLLLC